MFLASRLRVAIEGLTLLLSFGTIGFWVLGRMHYAGVLQPKLDASWSLLDCAYMTLITISTIGYGEVLGGDMSSFHVVRIYTMVLIMIGMIFVALSVSSATAFFVDGDLQRLRLRRRAMKQIARMKDHYIVCGCGVTGRVILQELLETGHGVVVIDGNPENVQQYAEHSNVVPVIGDATHDEVLAEAGIDRALGLAAALPSDKDNLFLIISVRQIRPDLRIVSQASELSVRNKLLRAGADAVVSSSFIGGLRLASELLRPAVVSFLDLMLRKSDSPVRFAQVEVGPRWSGKALREARIHDRTGLPVLAVTGGPGHADEFLFNPAEDLILGPGMVVVTMGEVARVQRLERLLGDADGATFIGGDERPLEEERTSSGRLVRPADLSDEPATDGAAADAAAPDDEGKST